MALGTHRAGAGKILHVSVIKRMLMMMMMNAGAGAGAKALTPLQMLELLEKHALKAAEALSVKTKNKNQTPNTKP